MEPGTSLGPYKIIEKLGAGGMGEVWLAKDTRIARRVALKILPRELAGDPERLTRLEREARMLATVDHPNIAVLHALEEIAGQRFMVMELIEGPTLAERIADGPLPLASAMETARQIASALEAAHDRGVIHRDLKPANVILTNTGRVKVLDFGLAKPVEANASGENTEMSTGLETVTRTGIVLGTMPYMSPEQLRGEDVDERTDVWAFGCLVYEMLTGRRVFAGTTQAEVAGAILEREPDWQFARGAPRAIRRLIVRCLAKDRVGRWSDMGAVTRELERALHARLGALSAVAGRVAVVLAVAAVGVGLVWLVLDRLGEPSEPTVPRLVNPSQVTSATGVEDYPAWSPDGRTLAYQSNQDGDWDIWIIQPGGSGALNRTADHAGEDRYPSYSSDGQSIAFWSERDGGGYFTMGALAGLPRKIVDTGRPADVRYIPMSPPQWSGDGTQLLYVVRSWGDSHAEIMNLESGSTVRVDLPGKVPGYDPVWSPDDSYVAYVAGWQREYETSQIRILRLSDRESWGITSDDLHHLSPTWLSDSVPCYLVNRGSSMDVWCQRLDARGRPDGEPVQLTAGVGMRQAVFSPDRSQLAYSKGRFVANLWRVPILSSRMATWANAEQLTFDQAWVEFVGVSPDAQYLAISTDRSGNKDIWVLPATGGEMRQLTTNVRPDWSPQFSPDGSEIAFYAYRDGARSLRIMPTAGGAALPVPLSGVGEQFVPAWSQDGSRLAFRAVGPDFNNDIYVAPREGGTPLRMTVDEAGDGSATWSPDGDWIAFRSNGVRIWRVLVQGGPPEALSPPGLGYHDWSPDGTHIYALGVDYRAGNLWEIDVADGAARQVTDLSGRRGATGSEALATDGNSLYFTWEEALGDIWIMDVAQGES